MTTLSVNMSDERYAVLEALAAQSGTTPEEYLRRQVEDALPLDPIAAATEYVLKKNAELYRRLA